MKEITSQKLLLGPTKNGTASTAGVKNITREDACSQRLDVEFLQRELSTPCKKQGYSQGNQDCQLDKIFEQIGTTNKYFVEYGFNTREQCSGSGPNTCKLWSQHNWTGLLLDGDNENPEINLHAHYLYGNNAADILKLYFVPEELDFLSGDMDSHDYFVMSNILEHFHPRVVTTEYNINWPKDLFMSQIDPTLVSSASGLPMDYSFKFEGCIWGASASAWKLLMEKNGYVLIGVTPGLDLIWGQTELFRCFDVPAFSDYQSLMGLGGSAHFQVPKEDVNFTEKLIDTSVWEKTNDLSRAKEAARTKLLNMMQKVQTTPHCLKKVSGDVRN